jgi:hypothetical protein
VVRLCSAVLQHSARQWQSLAQQFGFSIPGGSSGASSFNAITSLPHPAPNANVAHQQNQGSDDITNTLSGMGRIVINGEPAATWLGQVQLIGTRPGVDGLYNIWTASHLYSRQGYVTQLEVMPEVASYAASATQEIQQGATP